MLNKYTKVLRVVIMTAIVLGLFAPASAPVSVQAARVTPGLIQMAESAPDQMLRLIVQKVDDTDRAETLIESLGGIVIKDLDMINAFAAELPASELQQLTASDAIEWVSLDAPVIDMKKKDKDKDDDDDDEDDALSLNYFLDTLGVRQVWDMGYRGQGIGVAVIDSGIQKDSDFSRIAYRGKFSPGARSSNDKNGHGTHVAGIIAGNGKDSDGLYMGIAPEVTLLDLKISDEQGQAYESDTVEALQWVFENKDKYNIRVVNLSVNSSVESSYHDSALDAAVEILWFNGIVVVASAGNTESGSSFNPSNAAPANDPFIITVGATDEMGTESIKDDEITDFSASGKTSDGYSKPELVAPGRNIISVLSKKSPWDNDHEDRTYLNGQYFRLSGTSMSAPMVTGAVALLLQAQPDLTPDQVKYRLMHTGTNLSGYPYLNVYAALTTKTIQSANEGVIPHMLLAKMAIIAFLADADCDDDDCDFEFNDDDDDADCDDDDDDDDADCDDDDDDDCASTSVNWNSVNWNSVNWNSVNWNSVNWNSVNWNSVNWNSVNWNSVNWNSVNWNSVNWNSVNWNSVNWNFVNWNSVNWNSVNWD